jgi:hypothetical protein
MRTSLATVGLLVLSTLVHAQSANPLDEPKALAAAQERIDEAFRQGVDHDEETHELVIDGSAPAVAVSIPCTFDVQWGSGHGGRLTFVRFSVGVETTRVERLEYFAGSLRDRTRSWSARRASVPTADVLPLIQLARAEARTEIELRRRPGSGHMGGRISGSSRDFFVLTRVSHGAEKVLEREYAGYAGSRSARSYAGIDFVTDEARTFLDAIPSWSDVRAVDLRATHWTAAFADNADLMLREFHWWVMERSVEALGVFGNAEALPTLRHLDREYERPQPRQRAKIRNAIERPEHYLAGEAKVLPDELDGPAPAEAPPDDD